jgi:Carbon-nitrogen hydrolase
MAVDHFMSQLRAADDVLDLARRLGAACLDHEADLAEMTDDRRTWEDIRRLELWTGQTSLAQWEEVVEDPEQFEKRFGSKVVTLLRRAKTRHPMDCLGILRGLCRRPLGEFFAGVGDQLNLDRGLPVRFATRPLPEHLGSHCTTALPTLNNTGLLDPLPFDIYGHAASKQVRVVLDFGHRDVIDQLTWTEDGLPQIATLHPKCSGELDEITVEDGSFFGVRPREWDSEEVESLLAAAKKEGADIAVLPELSLPTPGELKEAIERNQESFPRIVVAGSAHVVEGTGAGQVRANESQIYLDGRYVARARKHHAFETNKVNGETYPDLLRENLTREQKTIMVLSGGLTRLAVVICADLQEREIPSLLVDAGVNLLLVPSMTRRIGSFNTAVCDIAGYCQGVAAVANTRWGDDGKPFLCLCAVPREEPEKQSAALPDADGKGKPAPVLGIFDPNKPLPEAVRWQALGADGTH